MITEIYTVLGPVHVLLSLVLAFFVLLVALSWIAYFVARSWKRGLIA